MGSSETKASELRVVVPRPVVVQVRFRVVFPSRELYDVRHSLDLLRFLLRFAPGINRQGSLGNPA